MALYRYFAAVTFAKAPMFFEDQQPDEVHFYCETFDIIRETPKAYWISVGGRETLVLKGNGKRYAHETQRWAWQSFIKRFEWRKWHHEQNQRRIECIDRKLETLGDRLPPEDAVTVRGWR